MLQEVGFWRLLFCIVIILLKFQPVLKRINASTVISSSEHIFCKENTCDICGFQRKKAYSYQGTVGAKAKIIKEQAKKRSENK